MIMNRTKSKKISKLSLYPEAGNFRDVVVGTTYFQKFTVKNLSDRSLSIRVSTPSLQQYTLSNYMPKKLISPGLDMVFTIEFYTTIERDFHDQIQILCGSEKMIIPLNAYLPQCRIIGPSSFDLGTVMPHSTTSKLFTVQNFGSLEGTFNFEFEDLPLHIIPKEGMLLPYSTQEIKVQYKSSDSVGIHQYTIIMKLDKEEKRKIEVLANVVECRIFLCHPGKGGSISQVNFDRVYFGQKRKKKVILTNTSGFRAKFSFRSRKDFYENNDEAQHCLYCGYRHLTDEDCETAKKRRITSFTIVPKKGVIGPFKKKEVFVWFDPKQEKKLFGFRTGEKTTKGFEEDWTMTISKKHKTDITLSGSATKPQVSFSNTKLRFRNCAVNDYRDIMVEITNSNDLPAKLEFDRVAHFYVHPSKCILTPKSKKQVTVKFHPNQLGFFTNKIRCVIESGLKIVILSVVGESCSVEKKKLTIGGIDKIHEDFERPKKYIKSSSMTTGGGFGGLAESENFEAPAASKILRYDRYAHEAVSIVKLQELQVKKRNEEKFNNYVTTLRKQKEITNRMKMIEQLSSNFMNDVNLGMIPTSGLCEPIPHIKLKEGKLFLKSDFLMSSKIRQSREMDENILIEKKFKPDPSNPNEKRECKIMLSKKQMLKVLTFPKNMEFGEMTVFGKYTKSFGVRNELKQVILVSLGSKVNTIQVYPERQIIPPQQSAGFDITVCANEAQVVDQNLFFRVNEHNKVRLTVHAEVIPANVVLSKSEIKFRFNDYTLDPYIDETVTLTNKGNAITSFFFEEISAKYHDLFELNPIKGEIQPNQTKQIHIVFKPSSTCKVVKIFKLKVTGATNDRELKCIADLKEAKLRCSEKTLNFDIRPVGIAVSKEVMLKNIGDEAVVFHVDLDSLQNPDLTVTPLKGRIQKKGKIPLSIELNPSEPTKYNINLIIRVRSGKRVKLKIVGESKTPNVMIIDTPDTINLGKVFVGGEKKQKISIKNVGEKIASVLYLDLADYTDFTVEDEFHQLVTVENPGKYISVVPIFTEDEFEDDDSQGDIISDVGDVMSEAGDFTEGLKYAIKIPANEVMSFFLVYKPTLAEIVDFKLRLYLAGMEHETIGKRIIAEGLQPKLVLSQNIIDFRSKVVVKQSMVPHRITISLTNEDKDDLKWWLGTKELSQIEEIFKVDVSEGRLRIGQSQPVIIFFLPSELKHYEYVIPVFLKAKGWDSKNAYSHLVLKGTGSFPKITFSVQEIILPVSPLGIESIQEFRIINGGYDKLAIKYKIPADKDKIPIEVHFPKKNIISRDVNEIPVEIKFKSDKPISFLSKIDFYDEDRNCYSLPISATSDNCILTSFSFMMQHRDSFSLQTEGKNKPIMIIPNGESLLLEDDEFNIDDDDGKKTDDDNNGRKSSFMQDNIVPNNAAMSVYSFATSMTKFTSTARALRQEFSRRSIKRLLNWLNATVMENPVDDLIRSLKQTRGTMLVEIIQMLSGKKVNTLNGSISGSLLRSGGTLKQKIQSTKKRVANFKNVILFLQSFGGLLSNIRPQFFLNFEEYKLLFENGELKQKCSEIVFRYRNIQAWVATLYQIIKLFSLKRITLGSFRSNPGIPKEVSSKSDKTLSTSNIMSVHENILLKWINFHVKKAYPSLTNIKRIIGFGKDLSNSIVFGALLKNHISPLQPLLSGLNLGPIQSTEYEYNARLIISSLKEAKIQYELSTQDIIQGNPRDLLLFVIFLYHILPQYLPKQTISFEGSLQENISKTIELFNPSKQHVEYTIQINYNSQMKNYRKNEFQISKDLILIPPKSKINFPFTVVPRFVETSYARVTFFPKKIGSYRPDVIVFNLETKVFTDQVSEKFETTSEIYKIGKIEIPVKNLFNKNGLFKITLEQSNSLNAVISQQKKVMLRTMNLSQKKAQENFIKELENRKFLPDPFWITRDHISITSNSTKKLFLNFLPFEHLVDYYVKIYFNDSNVGEFIYGVKGICTKSTEIHQTIEFSTEIMEPLKKEIKLRPINHTVEKALNILRDRNKKYRTAITNFEKSKYPDFLAGENQEIPFKIAFSNFKYFSGPKQFSYNPQPSEEVKPPLVPFTFQTKIPGIYQCFVSFDSEIDKRNVLIKVTARSPGIKAELNFQVPVRKKIQQDIPLQNRSSERWSIQATLKGDSRFSGPSEILVPSKKTVTYPLTFYPITKKDVTGELSLINPLTMEKYIFALKGKVEDPIAEGKLKVNCLARDKKIINVEVKKLAIDKQRIQKFKVESDLDFITYPKIFAIEEGENKGSCKITIIPTLGGKHTGSIQFTSMENGEILWYVVEVNVSRSNYEKEYSFKSVVRTKKNYNIFIENPVDKKIEYNVQLDGDGVSGSETILLGPKEKKQYNIEFLPFFVGEEIGSLSVFHEDVGEFWFLLKLISDEPNAIDIDKMECEIGKEKLREIAVTCPPLVEEPIVLNVSCDNPKIFRLESSIIECAPFVTGYIRIKYMPATFGILEKAVLVVSHPSIGKWSYNITGKGLRPTKIERIKIYAEENQSSSSVVLFKNPFSEKKKFRIVLTQKQKQQARKRKESVEESNIVEDDLENINIDNIQIPSKKSCFSIANIDFRTSLETKKKKKMNANNQVFSLRSHQVISIPLTFTPPSVGEYKADLFIELLDGLASSSSILEDEKQSLSVSKRKSRKTTPKVKSRSGSKSKSKKKSDSVISNKFDNNEPLRWKYFILGVTEVVNDDIRFHIKCKSRMLAKKRIKVPLKGVSEELGKSIHFTHEIDIPKNQSFLKAIKRTVKVTRIFKNEKKYSKYSSSNALKKRKKQTKFNEEVPRTSIVSKISKRSSNPQFYELEESEEEEEAPIIEQSENDENMENNEFDEKTSKYYFLTFEIEFGPLRPFEGIVNLIVKSRKSGVWKFEIRLTSSPPSHDQVIQIQAELGKKKYTSFLLNNIFANNIRFEAYFTPESPIDFDVNPERGILKTKGVEGTEFFVSYKAEQYGKMATGTLIIDTEEMQWRYIVKGVLPKIKKINKNELTSGVDNQLSPKIIKKRLKLRNMKKKNFLKNNVKNTSRMLVKKKKPKFNTLY